MEASSPHTKEGIEMANHLRISVGSDVHSVIVESDCTKIGTNFEGSGRDGEVANLAAGLELRVQFGSAEGPTVAAGFEAPLQLMAAALFAVGHKNAFVNEAPTEILDFLKPFTDKETGFVILYEGEE